MKAKTDIAVEQLIKWSIEKWEGIVSGAQRDQGRANCSLCQRFNSGNGFDCLQCPVVTHGNSGIHCEDTPYDAWIAHHINKHPGNTPFSRRHWLSVHCPECTRLAKKELKFLKLVLKEYMEG